MAEENLSLVLHGKLDLRFENRPIPHPGPGEVQIKIHSVGICGSDVSYWQRGCIGSSVVDCPTVMGHEPSGTVNELGEGVTQLKIGDRVALEPAIFCRKCKFCTGGRYNLCTQLKYFATPPCDGTLTRYVVHPVELCFRLPDKLSMEEGALIQPLALGIHTCDRAKIRQSKNLLVCGAGPVGLMCMLVAKGRGVRSVVMTDINQSRLDYALALGADHAVLAGNPMDTAKKISDLLGGRPEVSIECSGAQTSVTTAIYATESGGRLVLVGLGPPEMTIPIIDASRREVDLIGIVGSINDYPRAISLVEKGQVDVKQLISHRFKLEESLDAFNTAYRREGVKIIVNCQ